jgi:hypothetical protein
VNRRLAESEIDGPIPSGHVSSMLKFLKSSKALVCISQAKLTSTHFEMPL